MAESMTNRRSFRVSWLLLLSLGATGSWWSGGVAFVFQATTTSRPSSLAFLLAQQQQHKDEEWSIADDWNARSQHENRPASSENIFHQDVVGRAAFQMQQQQNYGEQVDDAANDAWVEEVLDDIHQDDDEDVHFVQPEAMEFDEDVMSREIAALVRCNEDPTQFLIQQGRAVPELTTEQLHDVTQLVTFDEETGKFGPTAFLQQAVQLIFDRHARKSNMISTNNNNESGKDHKESSSASPSTVMDPPAIAAWLQVCLSIPPSRCGPYDPRVQQVVSRFGKYKQGYLEMEDLENLYLHALVGTTSKHFVTRKKKQMQQSKNVTASTAYQLLSQQRSYEISQVWRDLEKHGLEPPVKTEWRARVDALTTEAMEHVPLESISKDPSLLFHDECEIMESPDEASVWTQDTDTGAWKRTGKSSHEKIELCKDGKTPLRFKDGDFVYIDEESCIGCNQCALAAPSSFMMLENGRARTFTQDTSPAVATAVTTCPVNCMHYVGFDRLKELEQARDDGKIFADRPGDHHRHFGPKQATGIQSAKRSRSNNRDMLNANHQVSTSSSNAPSQWIDHTPLYVSRMQSSDANHKESIYHFLRNQCYKSSACPQKGCYDCPMYASNPSSNPHWAKRVRAAYKIRAQEFKDNGAANIYRKTAEL